MIERKGFGIIIWGIRREFNNALFVSDNVPDAEDNLLDIRGLAQMDGVHRDNFYSIQRTNKFYLVTIVNPLIKTKAARQEYIAITLFTSQGNSLKGNPREVLDKLMEAYIRLQGTDVGANRFTVEDLESCVDSLKAIKSNYPAVERKECVYSVFDKTTKSEIDSYFKFDRQTGNFKEVYLFPLTSPQAIESKKEYTEIKDFEYWRLQDLDEEEMRYKIEKDAEKNRGESIRRSNQAALADVERLMISGNIEQATKLYKSLPEQYQEQLRYNYKSQIEVHLRTKVNEDEEGQKIEKIKDALERKDYRKAYDLTNPEGAGNKYIGAELREIKNDVLRQVKANDEQLVNNIRYYLDRDELDVAKRNRDLIVRDFASESKAVIEEFNSAVSNKKKIRYGIITGIVVIVLGVAFWFLKPIIFKPVVDAPIVKTDSIVPNPPAEKKPATHPIQEDFEKQTDSLIDGKTIYLTDDTFLEFGLQNTYLKHDCKIGNWAYSQSGGLHDFHLLVETKAITRLGNVFKRVKPCPTQTNTTPHVQKPFTGNQQHNQPPTQEPKPCTLCEKFKELKAAKAKDAKLESFKKEWDARGDDCDVNNCRIDCNKYLLNHYFNQSH